eukprot:5255979-Pyramimonas_sp.AAC.1
MADTGELWQDRRRGDAEDSLMPCLGRLAMMRRRFSESIRADRKATEVYNQTTCYLLWRDAAGQCRPTDRPNADASRGVTRGPEEKR